MHGREQRGEGEFESDHRRRRLRRCSSVQHMRSVPVSVTTTTTTRTLSEGEGESTIVSISAESFRKDGRTISVGDCALFKPPHDSPPFIGIIRQLLNSEENNLQLRVNWLYRPGELILGKGILLDAAPNEIFYSFHKDETPAASLLHPCRVAFLPKGVELPSGVSSFVCRRVYDIENKCLWWLNDQDYIDEIQEEVDKLLYRTRTEMHGNVQPGGRSPKPVNGPTSTSQSRPGSESMQNMGSFPSQVKGKKRERGDQGFDHVKRERVIKTDDVDSALSRTERNLKSEIARVTDKGGLVDFEGVEKIVHLMQPDKVEKKMDLITRSMLAGVIAGTEKFDCLNRFVELGGLPVFDEWLQDIHKGKIGDSSNSRDGVHKSTEEFLLVLLRALEKLPVNLNALQACNIGRSVNHLRSHKNTEIQKKARSLVDTWKKRVEAEMNILDAKSGSNQTVSWSSKSRLPETHGGNRNSVGSGDITARSSVTQVSASKISLNKPSLGETTKAASSSPGPGKSASSPVSVKENQPRTIVGGACDVPLSSREDKSSSSSQSHNYSHSVSCKEDAKSSAGSMSFSKVSSGGSRHRKSNGFPGTSVPGGQKDGAGRTSLQRSTITEKVSHFGSTGERSLDVPVIEGSSHKLIVKIPNRVRSPAQSANGGSFEDPSVMSSRASSPVLSDKHDKYDRNLKDKSDSYKSNLMSDVNAESWQSNDFKDALAGSRYGDGSPAALPDEEIRAAEDVRKAADTPKAASSASGNVVKSAKLHDSSFRSMNALIESCVKYSEANPSMSIGDDVGMNLLASVAAGEMSKSDLVSPGDSPQRSSSAAERTSVGDDARSKPSCGDNVPDGPQSNKTLGDDKKCIASDTKWTKDDSLQVMHASPEFSGEKKAVSFSSEEKLAGESNPSSTGLQVNAERCLESAEKMDGMKNVSSLSLGSMGEKRKEDKLNRQLHDEKAVPSTLAGNVISDAKVGVDGSSVHDMKVPLDVDVKQKVEVSRNDGDERLESNDHVSSKSPLEVTKGEVLPSPVAGKDLVPDNVHELKVGGSNGSDSGDIVDESERQSCVQDSNNTPVVEDRNMVAMDTEVNDEKRGCPESNDENKEIRDNRSCISSQKETPAYAAHDVQKHAGVGESKPRLEADGEKCSSTKAEGSSPSIAGEPNSDSKIEFDLNEGFNADDGKCGESVHVSGPAYPSNTQIVNPLPFAATSVSTSLPAPVTVAAAAKGPFLPPEDLLRNKGELGWKGSAATSAFRPAEPRKALQMQSGSLSSSPPEVSASKHGRALLDIDLNVPDERVLEDLALRDSATDIGSSSDFRSNCDISRSEVTGGAPVRSSGGLDLDLNRSDESSDVEQYLLSSSRRPEPPVMPVKTLSAGGLSTSELRRDFDLNNGPCVEDANAETSFTQHIRGSIHTQPPVAGLRMSNADIGNFASWFPPGNSYSTVTIPSILPDRGQQPFPIIPPGASHRILGPAANTPFPSDVYRGSVLSSSPSVPFASNPFPYPVYPFGTTFPLPSATFSIGSTSYIDSSAGGRLFTQPANSQLPVPVDAVSSHYPRHYMVSLPESSRVSSAENNRKWGRQGLDLNAGPGALDVEGREAMLPIMSMQQSVASSQSLAEEQARIFAVGGSVLKRKEPESGFDNESFRYKQSSWQ